MSLMAGKYPKGQPGGLCQLTHPQLPCWWSVGLSRVYDRTLVGQKLSCYNYQGANTHKERPLIHRGDALGIRGLPATEIIG